MKLHVTQAAGQNLFTGYGDGYVSINHQHYAHNVLLAPGREVARWDAPGFEGLTRAHFEALLALAPEIVILGTGDTLRFPHPELTRSFAAAAVGFEAMDTKAACRTYNILMAEGRAVVAAILLGA
jgi:uncharacterized protein